MNGLDFETPHKMLFLPDSPGFRQAVTTDDLGLTACCSSKGMQLLIFFVQAVQILITIKFSALDMSFRVNHFVTASICNWSLSIDLAPFTVDLTPL